MEDVNKTNKTASPSYGSSAHYSEKSGEAYFNKQQLPGKLASRWNLYLWSENINPDDQILDFGCGGGDLLSMLPGKRKVGVEINPAAYKYANALGIDIYPTLDDVPLGGFTKAISSHALEHIPHPLIALKGIHRLLLPTGILLLLLPLDDWRAKPHRMYKPGNVDRHLYNWTPQILGNLLEEAGYTEIEIKLIEDAMPPNPKLVNFLQNRIVLRRIIGRSLSFILKRRQLFAKALVQI